MQRGSIGNPIRAARGNCRMQATQGNRGDGEELNKNGRLSTGPNWSIICLFILRVKEENRTKSSNAMYQMPVHRASKLKGDALP